MQDDDTKLDLLLLQARQAESGKSTSACPDMESLIDFADSGSDYPNANELLDHMARCASCRKEYAQLVKDFRLAAKFHRMQAIHTSIFSSPLPGQHLDSLRTHGSRIQAHSLAASTTPGELLSTYQHQQICCHGTLLATIIISRGQSVLLAENHADALWEWDENGRLLKVTGSGINLAGEMMRYDLETREGPQYGYFVLPIGAKISKAEVILGVSSHLSMSPFSCRRASPTELVDPDQVKEYISRARVETTRRAWLEYARLHEEILPENVILAINRVAA